MVTILDLWLPIVLSGVAIFFLSFIVWMVLPHHRSDWAKMPDEDAAMNTLGDIPSGQYTFPHCGSPEMMKDPEWVKKAEDGPSGLLVIRPRGPMNMGKSMFVSFVYNIVIGIVVAYLATIAFERGEDALTVFRFTATTAFLGCAGALGWNAIWFSHSWSSTLKSACDGLLYGIATGLIFMWMWPAA